MKRLALLALLLLTSCATTPRQPTPDVAAIYTSAAGTVLADATKTANVQKAFVSQTTFAHSLETIVAIPTNTPLPTYTPGPTFTATLPPLYAPKEDGHYLINVDIAPGVWRNNGTGNSCYWEVTTKTGDIIDNDLGMGGGTAYIPPDGFEVTFERCGTWTWLQGP